VAENKIPLLTEVYQPKTSVKADSNSKEDSSVFITPELIARISSHVRPRLEAEITQSVLISLSDGLKKVILKDLQVEIKNTQQSIEANTADFVDRTKADLKTELPRMYQASADLVLQNLTESIATLQNSAISTFDSTLAEVRQASIEAANKEVSSHVEALQTDASARISHDLNQELQAFHVQSLSNHQTLLEQQLGSIFESISQEAKTDLQQHLAAMQADALAQMRTTFLEAMPSIYSTAVDEQQEVIANQISRKLNEEMQAFQAQALSDNQAQLTQSLTESFQSINENTKADLQEQLSIIQADAVEQMRTTLNASIPSIYAAAADEVKAKFASEMVAQSMQVRESFLATINADLPAVQQVMRDNIQQILATSLPNLELDLRKQLTVELEELLLKVKFVLPK